MTVYLIEQLTVLQLLCLALELSDGHAHVSRDGQVKAGAVALHRHFTLIKER